MNRYMAYQPDDEGKYELFEFLAYPDQLVEAFEKALNFNGVFFDDGYEIEEGEDDDVKLICTDDGSILYGAEMI